MKGKIVLILKFSFHSESTTTLNYQMDVLPRLTQNIGLFRCFFLLLFLFDTSKIICISFFLMFFKLLTTPKTLEHAANKFYSIKFMSTILLFYVPVQINLTFTVKTLLNEVLEYKSLRFPVSTCESFRSTSKRNLSATSCFGFKSEME